MRFDPLPNTPQQCLCTKLLLTISSMEIPPPTTWELQRYADYLPTMVLPKVLRTLPNVFTEKRAKTAYRSHTWV